MRTETQEIRVMLVDDHVALREPLAFMLGREPDFAVVAQAGSVAEAKEALKDEDLVADVAIVDLDLPDGSGVDFVRALHDARPRAAAVVLSALSEREWVARAIEAGAAAIMHKSTTRMEDIAEAVRGLYRGEQLLSQREVLEALRLVTRERQKNHEQQLMVDRLTPRELEVLQALAEGLSDKEISSKLYVSVGTIHTHVASILTKIEAHSRLQALIFAVRNGIAKIE